MMKERPILFSSQIVQAILAGRKTQTRRVLNRVATLGPVTEFQRSATPGYDWIMRDRRLLWNEIKHADLLERCPHGAVGDRLWVRETWRADDYAQDDPERTIYRADADAEALEGIKGIVKFRPSIHMPRNRARILLEITDVRVQRLQEISDSDALAEGIVKWPPVADSWKPQQEWNIAYSSPTKAFRALWQEINAERAPWDSNPWVWAITFRLVDQ
jgi:hypothetical protein